MKEIEFRQMKSSIFVVTIFAVALAGCRSAPVPVVSTPTPVANTPMSQQTIVTMPAPVIAAPTPPKYGWKVFSDQIFEPRLTGESTVFALPRNASKLRVQLTSQLGIYGGVFPHSLAQTHRIIIGHKFRSVPCSLVKVEKDEITCEISHNEQMDFIVRDAHEFRRAYSALKGFLFATHLHIFGAAKGVDSATAPNKVSLKLSAWECIENCRK